MQQAAQQACDTGTSLRDLPGLQEHGLDLDVVFDLNAYTQHARMIVSRLSDLDPAR